MFLERRDYVMSGRPEMYLRFEFTGLNIRDSGSSSSESSHLVRLTMTGGDFRIRNDVLEENQRGDLAETTTVVKPLLVAEIRLEVVRDTLWFRGRL